MTDQAWLLLVGILALWVVAALATGVYMNRRVSALEHKTVPPDAPVVKLSLAGPADPPVQPATHETGEHVLIWTASHTENGKQIDTLTCQVTGCLVRANVPHDIHAS